MSWKIQQNTQIHASEKVYWETQRLGQLFTCSFFHIEKSILQTSTKFSIFELMFGRTASGPMTVLEVERGCTSRSWVWKTNSQIHVGLYKKNRRIQEENDDRKVRSRSFGCHVLILLRADNNKLDALERTIQNHRENR